MDFDEIFEAYYTLFRADSDVPTSSEDEYTVGMRLANEAINRWAEFDATYWKELFTTNQTDGTGAQVLVLGQTEYDAPTNFREAGGKVWIKDASGNKIESYRIIEPHEVQFQGDNSQYCYFHGSPKTGYKLVINPEPLSNYVGYDIEYLYYKSPTKFTTGTDKTEMADPYFIVHRMLANQFRAARNPYYSSAKADAENALKQMQMDNNSGTWSNPWTLADTSGTQFGG
jgi:hypothetical protein